MKKKIIIVILTISFAISGHAQDLKDTVFIDDFESYNAGEQLVVQNPTDWTTWTNSPGSDEDPFIIDTLAYSGTQSVIIVDSNDLVKPIANYTEGKYKISFYMYIPGNCLGYFNTLQLFNGLYSEWGMQVFFNSENTAYINHGESNIYFSYDNNTWLYNELIIDLDNDWAEYFLNSILIEDFVWSEVGWSGINQLGGSNFYAWDNNGTGISKYYIDDYQIEELEPFQLLPPENLTLEIWGNDIILNWDNPFQTYWLHYDGENYGNGIGPGPVYIAARFLPEDIQALNGMFLTKIKFFARNSDCSYSLRVWTGENAGNLIIEQDVPEFIPDSWNEIELNTPILIDASQELWLGNICSSINVWDYPAACDEGPAFPYQGDLVSFDGINWVSMFLEYGLDYNWNIRGLVTENTDNKSFIRYNVYFSFNWSPFEMIGFTTDSTFSHDGLGTGNYEYYVTALYDEGESGPSDTVSAFLTNINENKINNIRISPNPAKDFIQIESESEINNLTLYDMTARIKKEITEINKTNFNFSVADCKQGIYTLRMETDNETIIKKIIIK